MKLGVLSVMGMYVRGYSEEKVFKYFKNFDTNNDGVLMRSEYEDKLLEEDVQMGMEQDKEYYSEITSLIFDKYDVDGSGGLDGEEWVNFAVDIYDYKDYEGAVKEEEDL